MKITSYVLMLAGIVLIAVPIFAKKVIEIIKIPSYYIIIAGLGLLVAGFFVMKPSAKHKQADEEVPIYHKDKIVGYRRAEKH